ncbi:MAG: anti-sigma factor family protein [Planctomycetota bacterium]|jgi:anti-sigma factor RsiW
MSMDCSGAHERMLDHVAGRLPGDRAGELEEHVHGCPACAEILRGIEANERVLFRAKAPSAPDTIWPRIEAAVERRRTPAAPRKLGWLVAAAAVLLVAAAVVLSLPDAPAGPELEIVEVRGEASGVLGGLIPGFEEPNEGTRLAGAMRGSRNR